MEISMMYQLTITLYSVIVGLCLGLIYDIVRIGRVFFGINYKNKFIEKLKKIKLPLINNPMNKEIKKREKRVLNIIVGLGDLLYFFAVTPVMVIFVYHFNNGNVRWYLLFGSVCGFIIYYFTIGKILISVSEYIVFFIKIISSYFAYIFLRPVIKVFCILKKYIKKLFKFIKSKIKKHFFVKRRKKELNTHVPLAKSATPLIYSGKCK